MAKRFSVFEHFGPYGQVAPIAAFCDLSERVWSTCHALAGAYEHKGTQTREYLIVRMLYIAEVTSSAIRLNATWGLTHAAMSLLRDRYEQVVRFSWLVRNPNQTEFQKYERAMFAKMNALVRNMGPELRAQYHEFSRQPLPAWATETLTREQRSELDAWNALNLRTMAEKRDDFPPIADTFLAKEGLAHFYDSIYAQFSSVTHYDRFGIELLGIQTQPDGSPAFGAQPHWPGLLILQNAQFDIIQCFEASQVCHKRDAAQTFETFLAEWIAISKQLVPR
jgi:hypothetical protein